MSLHISRTARAEKGAKKLNAALQDHFAKRIQAMVERRNAEDVSHPRLRRD